jgi:hypothetical protein
MSSHHSMNGSRAGSLDASGGKSGLQLSEIEAGDGGTRMPILSSSGSGYARTASNWVERLTFFLLLFVGVGIVAPVIGRLRVDHRPCSRPSTWQLGSSRAAC